MTKNPALPFAPRKSKALARSRWAICLGIIGTCIACSTGSGGDDDDGTGGSASNSAATGGNGANLGASGTGGMPGKGSGGSGGTAAGSGTAGSGGSGTGSSGMSGAGTGGINAMTGGSGGSDPIDGGSGGSDAVDGGLDAGEAESCPLPTTFHWTSDAALAQPKSGWVSLKDFTHVLYKAKHLIYMTTHDQANWGSAMFTFDDWSDAASATQVQTSFGVAPTLFYFTPKELWVIAYQWGPHKFSYRTSTDPSDPNGWSGEHSLYNTALPNGGTGPIDQTVICNSSKCYLYYAGDNGHIYKSSLAIDSFPGEFPGAQDSGIAGTSQNLFEAVQVYAIKGSEKYLMIVEAQGSARYFRAWTATDLEGPWTLLTDTFAAKSNVTFSSAWTNDISHGDLVRTNPDETFTVDPCNLQMVFQGRDPNANVDYGLLPYRPGLLTLVK
jgi:hypothetical protein